MLKELLLLTGCDISPTPILTALDDERKILVRLAASWEVVHSE